MKLENAFWQYSLRLYARPDVTSSCLQLQDNYGLDVNQVLFMHWLGKQGLSLTPSQFWRLQEKVGFLRRQLILPVRKHRRHPALRSMLFYEPLKQVELLAEQWQQAIMWDFYETESSNMVLPGRPWYAMLLLQLDVDQCNSAEQLLKVI